MLSPEFKNRLRYVWSLKRAKAAAYFLVLLFAGSLLSEWVTNSKPIVAVIHGKTIFPAYVDYNRATVGLVGAGTIDYREIREEMSFSIWPLFNWDPFENDYSLDVIMSGPSRTHLMGTDTSGRDIFARLLYGTRITFFFAFAVWIGSYLIGTVLGLVQGFFGGKVDILGQRVVEVFASTPQFYLLLLLITILTPSPLLLVPIATVFNWVAISQYMRAEALRNRNLPYTEAARAMGAGRMRVLFKHILPNSLVPLVTFSPFAIVGGVYELSSLDLLGFGVPAPTPSWGELLDQARSNFQIAWWLAVFPSLFLFATVVSLNMFGEALRTAFDAKTDVSTK